MPKAIISNRIYLHIPEDSGKELRDILTYKIKKQHNVSNRGPIKFNPIEIIKNYKIESPDVISIPQGRFDLIPKDYEIVDRRVINEVPFPLPKYPLREGQQVVYDQVQDSCMINALVGWGKTFTALYIAAKLGQKTLVITHNTMLRDQWVKEVQDLFGMDPGIIGSGKFDIEDHAIVIGNVQSLIKYLPKLAKEFGTVIMDECHHTSANTFKEILDTLHARYRIGLSGTLTRTDGKHVIFNDYFGFRVYKPPQSHTLDPVVRIIPTGIHLPAVEWAKKINALLYDEDYQDFVARLAQLEVGRGHSVLVVGSRVEFLEKIKDKLGADCVLIAGSSNSSAEERERVKQQINSGEKTSIAGTRQIFTEGISINRLSCVILAEPTSNKILLEQLIGRIMRQHDGKPDPLVIDLNFSSPAERKQNNMRLGFYLDKGWKINKI